MEHSMDTISESSEFALSLDAETAQKFAEVLNDEGIMRAGFVIHESNNNNQPG